MNQQTEVLTYNEFAIRYLKEKKNRLQPICNQCKAQRICKANPEPHSGEWCKNAQ